MTEAGGGAPPKCPFDGRPELRAMIHERLGFVRLHAENGQRYAGDDVGVSYSLACLRAHTVAALGGGKALMSEAKIEPT